MIARSVAPLTKDFDFFVSHASEEKESVASPIAQALTARGYRVWFDKGELTVGDRLMRTINEGLARSRYGVVILSRAFFQKDWPQWELEGLAAIENTEGRKVILPVWHQLTLQDIAAIAPLLAGRLASNTSKGIEHVVNELIQAYELGLRDVPVAELKQSEIPSVADAFEQEPLDLYADAEEMFANGHTAINRIVAAMGEFTQNVKQFTAENEALVAAGTRLGPKALRARVNTVVPVFEDYRRVIERGDYGEVGRRGITVDDTRTHPR